MLSKILNAMTRPELEHMIEELNLSDEQELIVRQLAKRKSIQAIALEQRMSTRTIDREVQRIKKKMERIE